MEDLRPMETPKRTESYSSANTLPSVSPFKLVRLSSDSQAQQCFRNQKILPEIEFNNKRKNDDEATQTCSESKNNDNSQNEEEQKEISGNNDNEGSPENSDNEIKKKNSKRIERQKVHNLLKEMEMEISNKKLKELSENMILYEKTLKKRYNVSSIKGSLEKTYNKLIQVRPDFKHPRERDLKRSEKCLHAFLILHYSPEVLRIFEQSFAENQNKIQYTRA